MAGGCIRNDESRETFSTCYLVEKAEVNMEVSSQIEMYCQDVGVTGKLGYLGNNAVVERVCEFGNSIREDSIFFFFLFFLTGLHVLKACAY